MQTNTLISIIKHIQNMQILYFIGTQAPSFDKENGTLILAGSVEIEAVIPTNSLKEFDYIKEDQLDSAENKKAANLVKHLKKKDVLPEIKLDGTQIVITSQIPVTDKEQYVKIMELLFDNKAELEELLAEIEDEDDYDDYGPAEDDGR